MLCTHCCSVVKFASGTPATVSISLAAHHTKWSLTLVGTAGSLEVMRGGWGGNRGEYALAIKRASEQEHEVCRQGAECLLVCWRSRPTCWHTGGSGSVGCL